jgi:hypothetical protein
MANWSPDNRRFEILGIAEEEEGFEREDQPGSVYQPATPDQFRLRLLRRLGEGPNEQYLTLQDHGLFHSLDAANSEAERLKEEDPDLYDVPIVPIV